jgi:HEAT repeat protein
MAIHASCPHCHHKYTLDDRQAGKTLLCKHCHKPFVLGPSPGPGAAPAGPSRQAVQSRAPAPARPGPRDRDDEEDDRERPPRARKKSRLPLILGLSLGGGALAILGIVLLVFASLPSELDRNLAALKEGEPEARALAIQWFNSAEPQPAHRARVTAALEGRLALSTRPQVAHDLLNAYLRWADKDNVPTMIAMVDNPPSRFWGPPMTGMVMEALGRIKDERAVEVLARKLSDFFVHDQAVNALKQIGPGAEKIVLGYLFHPDGGTRNRARDLLVGYGVKQEAMAAEAVRRLQSAQAGEQRTAAAWFAENPPADKASCAAVAPALAKLLDDLSADVRAQALRGLKFWGDSNCLPKLLEFARREEKAAFGNQLLVEVLVQFKDERAAEAIALQLPNFHNRGNAAQALAVMGPVAGKAVLPYLNHPDGGVQAEARRLCGLLKVSAERQLEQTIADTAGPETARRRAALQYLAKLVPEPANRVKVSKALNPALLDPDNGVREDAITAVKTWSTKENTAALVKALEASAGGLGRNGRIIEILGLLNDPQAAPALAKGLDNFFERGAVTKILKNMGPAAEAAVVPYLQSKDGGTRVEACRILGDIGTKTSLNALMAAAQVFQRDGGFVNEAQAAYQKILARR